jgi:replicative DNA helicase
MEKFKNINPVRSTKRQLLTWVSSPQVLELEEAVLGAMMIDKKGVDDVIDILSPEAFIKRHTNIF